MCHFFVRTRALVSTTLKAVHYLKFKVSCCRSPAYAIFCTIQIFRPVNCNLYNPVDSVNLTLSCVIRAQAGFFCLKRFLFW